MKLSGVQISEATHRGIFLPSISEKYANFSLYDSPFAPCYGEGYLWRFSETVTLCGIEFLNSKSKSMVRTYANIKYHYVIVATFTALNTYQIFKGPIEIPSTNLTEGYRRQ